MATPLYRRGRFSFLRPWRVIGVWFVLLGAILGAGVGLGGTSQEPFVIADTALDRVPAAVVNNDSLSYTTAADGSRQAVFAGRQLVTELTGNSTEFDWKVTNQAEAKEALAAGDVYAILTIPADFSGSILSLSTSEPKRANLAITTDDSHSYLPGALATSIGDSVAHTFGNTVTEGYLSGIYTSLGTLGTSIGDAATGARSLERGVTSYTGGVDELSSGLRGLKSASSGLSAISSGVSDFTGGVSSLASALAAANTDFQVTRTSRLRSPLLTR